MLTTNGGVSLRPRARTACVRTIINIGEKGMNFTTTAGLKYRSGQHVLVTGESKRRM